MNPASLLLGNVSYGPGLHLSPRKPLLFSRSPGIQARKYLHPEVIPPLLLLRLLAFRHYQDIVPYQPFHRRRPPLMLGMLDNLHLLASLQDVQTSLLGLLPIWMWSQP